MQYVALITKTDGSFLVEFPGLDGCLTEGSTLEDALLNAKEALDGWLESNYERNLTVKEPEVCYKLAVRVQKKKILAKIPVSPVLTLAYQMRFSRKKAGNRTLAEIAELMNISQQHYSKTFENPKANPTLASIQKGLEDLGYFLELNIVPKSESLSGQSNASLRRVKFKIQTFDLPERKKRRA